MGSKVSSGYRVMADEPGEAAERLGYPLTTRVISGKVVGALKFHSGGHERKFLEEAGQSFCLSLMEDELAESGTKSILALKTFVLVHYASCTFQKEVEDLCPYMQSSDYEKVVKLEAENAALAEAWQHKKERAEDLAWAYKVAAADNKRLS